MSTRLSTLIGFALCTLLLGASAYSQSPPNAGAAFRASIPGPSYVLQKPAGRIEKITVHGASLVGNLEGDSPDREVLVARDGAEVTQHVRGLTGERARADEQAALRRVLAEHTYAHRAAQLEALLETHRPAPVRVR